MELREWQRDAFSIWHRERRGVASVVTGGGKTVFGLYCFQAVIKQTPDCRLVVVVPTIALMDQWAVAITDELGITDVKTYSGEGIPDEPGLANVLVVNTARRMLPQITANGSWMLIVDECHRVATPQNQQALTGTYYATLGLSATPEREYDDGLQRYILPILGPIVYTYGYAEARRDGVIADFELINVKFSLLASEAEEYQRLTRSIQRAFHRRKRADGTLTHDALENLLRKRAAVSTNARFRIPTTIALLRAVTGKAIVFHERIAAAEEIRALTDKLDRRPVTYHSRINGDVRRQRLAQFRSGIFDTLITCRSLDEGLNVPDATIGIISASTRSSRQRIQRLGRVLRTTNAEKYARIYTLYATDIEERQLQSEALLLTDVAAIRWFTATRSNNAE